MSENRNNDHDIENISDEDVQVFQVDELATAKDPSEEILHEAETVNTVQKKNKKKVRKTKSKKSRKKKAKKEKQKEKQPKLNVAIILGVLVLISGLIFASWEFYFSYDEYNPFDYIQVIEKGAEGQAYLEIEKDELVLDGEESLILSEVEFAIPKNENLSVGDVREIKVVLDGQSAITLKDEKIRLSPKSMEYTVGEVADLDVIDVLESLEIEYVVEKDQVRVDNIVAQISDLDLRDLLIFETTDKLLNAGDEFTISIKDTKALDTYILENGIEISAMEKEFTVEAFEYVPITVKDLPDIENIKQNSLESLEYDLNLDEVLYEDFKIKSMCYTNDPQNKENARDKNYGHEYSKGSLMFIIEFNIIDDEDKTVYADAIGYTNIVVKDDEMDQNQILEMNPFYENASHDEVKREMDLNNFECSKN